jgi:hypothetical protein
VKRIKPVADTEPLPKDKRKGALQQQDQEQKQEQEQDQKQDQDQKQEKQEQEQEQDQDKKQEQQQDEDVALIKVLSSMRTQYILGYEKRKLEPGKIGLCPLKLDEILGQNGSDSVIKGASVVQHFKDTAKVFVRFGLGNRGASPGLSFLELLGFYLGNLQRAGKPTQKGTKLDIPTVYTPQAVLKLLVPIDSKNQDELNFLIIISRAFERANYGNLVHEFAGASDNLTTAEIQKFAQDQDFDLAKNPSIRPHVTRLANAWYNFVDYLKDETATKELHDKMDRSIYQLLLKHTWFDYYLSLTK